MKKIKVNEENPFEMTNYKGVILENFHSSGVGFKKLIKLYIKTACKILKTQSLNGTKIDVEYALNNATYLVQEYDNANDIDQVVYRVFCVFKNLPCNEDGKAKEIAMFRGLAEFKSSNKRGSEYFQKALNNLYDYCNKYLSEVL